MKKILKVFIILFTFYLGLIMVTDEESKSKEINEKIEIFEEKIKNNIPLEEEKDLAVTIEPSICNKAAKKTEEIVSELIDKFMNKIASLMDE